MSNTITIKVKETSFTDVQLQLPAYFGSTIHFVKIISENEALNVCTLERHESITHNPYITDGATESPQITEAEFLEALNRVQGIMSELAMGGDVYHV